MAERGLGLEIYMSILREAMATGEPRTLSEVFADRLDALLAARGGAFPGGPFTCSVDPATCVVACYENEALTASLRADLTTARERVAELEAALERGCGVCCALLGPPASDPAPTADRSAPHPHKGSCAKAQCCQRPDDCKWGGSGGCGRENELCSCGFPNPRPRRSVKETDVSEHDDSAAHEVERLNEVIGLIRDKAENYLTAARMPVSPATHVIGLTGGMEEILGMAKAALEES